MPGTRPARSAPRPRPGPNWSSISMRRLTTPTALASASGCWRRRAADASCALVYVNAVGGQDELVFDGASMVFDAEGRLVAALPQFEESVSIFDLEVRPDIPQEAPRPPRWAPRPGAARSDGEHVPAPAGLRPPHRSRRWPRPLGEEEEIYRGIVLGTARLRAQERFQRRGHRPVRRDRLVSRGDHRRGRPWCAGRPRRFDAVALHERHLPTRTRPNLPPGSESIIGQYQSSPPTPLCSKCWLGTFAGQRCRSGRREHPKPVEGGRSHGAVQQVRLAGPYDGQ